MLAKQIFGDLTSKTVILVGAGEMVEFCGRHLHDKGLSNLIIANRSIARATELAEQFGAHAVALTDLPGVLHKADILISSTASVRNRSFTQNQLKACTQAASESTHVPG